MATTSHYGLPKSDISSSPNGPAQLDAALDAIDAALWTVAGKIPTVQTGNVDVSVTAANTPSTTHVTFSPSFAQTPKVFVDPRAFFPLLNAVDVVNVTTTGFDLIFERSDGASTITVDWLAIRP